MKYGAYTKCVVCGKKFKLVHGKGTKVCSKECLGKLRHDILHKEPTKGICKNCGKEFDLNYATEKRDFCSRDCYWEYRRKHANDEFLNVFKARKESTREVRKCEMCGNEFEVYKKTKKRFCSDECRKKYQNTSAFYDKRMTTMLERYGKKAIGNGITAERLKEYETARQEKYQKLCDVSDMELVEYVDRHILLVRCKKCGAEFVTNNLSYLPYEKILCKHCSEEYQDYKPAVVLYKFLDELGVTYIKNDRNVIRPYELDIYIPSHSLAIEVNGNFWHSELAGKDKEYHISKTKMANDVGVRLIHIFEDEIVNRFDIVKSRLKTILGFTEKIYARKCLIKELTQQEKREFLNKTHIQGDTNSSINLGLEFNGEIVAAMTFSKERIIYSNSDANGYELIRYANKLNSSIIGGFSRLLKHFIKEYKPKSIKTFCDARWSGVNPQTTVYSKCGFAFESLTKPNYWYMYKCDMLSRKHRFTFTKHNILKKNPNLDANKTEWELMQELGYNRIWDCGNMKFRLMISN